MTDVRITIESVGATDIAVGKTEDGRRVMVRQPAVGVRLEVGSKISVEERFARKTILDAWTWDDRARARVVEAAHRQERARLDARIAAHCGAIADAVAHSAIPTGGASWEEALEDFLRRIPPWERDLQGHLERREHERAAAALQAWIDWAHERGIARQDFDRVLRRHVPHDVLFRIPLERPRERLSPAVRERLTNAPLSIPPDVLELVQRLEKNARLAEELAELALDIPARWVEDVLELEDVPRERYFVVARLLATEQAGFDEDRAWCIDRREPRGPLVLVTREDGAELVEVQHGLSDLRALVRDRIDFAISVEEGRAAELSMLTKWTKAR